MVSVLPQAAKLGGWHSVFCFRSGVSAAGQKVGTSVVPVPMLYHELCLHSAPGVVGLSPMAYSVQVVLAGRQR